MKDFERIPNGNVYNEAIIRAIGSIYLEGNTPRDF